MQESMKLNIWISVVFKNIFLINNFVMKFFIRPHKVKQQNRKVLTRKDLYDKGMKLAKFVNAPLNVSFP